MVEPEGFFSFDFVAFLSIECEVSPWIFCGQPTDTSFQVKDGDRIILEPPTNESHEHRNYEVEKGKNDAGQSGGMKLSLFEPAASQNINGICTVSRHDVVMDITLLISV